MSVEGLHWLLTGAVLAIVLTSVLPQIAITRRRLRNERAEAVAVDEVVEIDRGMVAAEPA